MVFSSISFLYYFLPMVLLFYFIVPSKFKNVVLLIFSLLFYFYGEPKYIWVLILSCVINYIFGLIIEKHHKKIYLILDITFNLLLLCYFKYTNFFIQNINNLFSSNLSLIDVVMPIGISFFTFQTMSYVIDVYRGDLKANKNILNFSTYVCLFPQLVAGPIVRYKDINEQLTKRKVTFDLFASGVGRFIIGLAKKVLVANVIGQMCNSLLGLPNITVLAYILVAIGFTIQIYFDFSGYSDMAIGLGRMFGFNFFENFNYPLISSSITEFWRRWHISLSSFFRDYVYIPLGGNRVSKIKWIRNIFIVWFLTGFWHGAAWNFIIWGLFFACFLLIEKLFLKDFLDKHKIIGHIYTLFLVIISFVIFNADSFNYIINFLKNLFGFGNIPFINKETMYYFRSYGVILFISFVAATPLFKNLIIKFRKNNNLNTIIDILEVLYYLLLLLLVTSYLIDASFNPFLYFRF